MTRFDNLVLISYHNWWGKVFSKFIDFSSGEEVFDIDEKFLSILIHEKKLYFINQDKEIGCYSLNSKTKIFKVATKGLWSWDGTPPKISLIDKSIYAFSKRKIIKVNKSNGAISQTELPIGLNHKYISHLLDEFQVNVNTLSNYNFVHSGFITGDTGGGDAVGGDSVGGGGNGGG